jgi:hypothetical protein
MAMAQRRHGGHAELRSSALDGWICAPRSIVGVLDCTLVAVVDVQPSMLDYASPWHDVDGSGLSARRKPLSCCWTDDDNVFGKLFLGGICRCTPSSLSVDLAAVILHRVPL